MADYGTVTVFDIEELFTGDSTSYAWHSLAFGTASTFDIEETYSSPMGTYLLAGTAPTVLAAAPQTTGQIWPQGPAAVSYTPPVTSIVGQAYANQGGAGSTALAMTLPTGLVDGDRIYIAAMTANTNAGTVVTESKAGWTTINAKADQGTCQRAFYTAIYSAGLVAPSWALSVASKSCYAAVAIRNPDPLAASAMTDVPASSTDAVAPSIASAPQGVWLRFVVKKDNLSASVTPPAGSTLVTGALGVATGPSAHILVYSQTPAPGTMPTATTSFSVASANGTAWSVAA